MKAAGSPTAAAQRRAAGLYDDARYFSEVAREWERLGTPEALAKAEALYAQATAAKAEAGALMHPGDE